MSVLTTISSVLVCKANIPSSLLTRYKLLPLLLKLLITVVPLTALLLPAVVVPSVINPPALNPGLLGTVGVLPALVSISC